MDALLVGRKDKIVARPDPEFLPEIGRNDNAACQVDTHAGEFRGMGLWHKNA
jgi:hypothetical protein